MRRKKDIFSIRIVAEYFSSISKKKQKKKPQKIFRDKYNEKVFLGHRNMKTKNNLPCY